MACSSYILTPRLNIILFKVILVTKSTTLQRVEHSVNNVHSASTVKSEVEPEVKSKVKADFEPEVETEVES